MKVIGARSEPLMTGHASGDALTSGAHFSESLTAFSRSTFIPKGVYRFKTLKR